MAQTRCPFDRPPPLYRAAKEDLPILLVYCVEPALLKQPIIGALSYKAYVISTVNFEGFKKISFRFCRGYNKT